MMSLVHDLAEADVGDITPFAVSGTTREEKLAKEEVRAVRRSLRDPLIFVGGDAPNRASPARPRQGVLPRQDEADGALGGVRGT